MRVAIRKILEAKQDEMRARLEAARTRKQPSVVHRDPCELTQADIHRNAQLVKQQKRDERHDFDLRSLHQRLTDMEVL